LLASAVVDGLIGGHVDVPILKRLCLTGPVDVEEAPATTVVLARVNKHPVLSFSIDQMLHHGLRDGIPVSVDLFFFRAAQIIEDLP